MRTKKLGLLIGSAAVALGLSLLLSTPGSSNAATTLPSLSAAPNPTVVGQTVTVQPTDNTMGCPGTSVDLHYFDGFGGQMNRSITLSPADSTDDLWADHIAFDQAGAYTVTATCNGATAPAPAGHLSRAGTPAPSSFDYSGATIQVNAELSHTPEPALVGEAVSIVPKAGGECPNGTVTLTITNPDASTTTPANPTVQPDGTWTSVQTFAAPGTYKVEGTCTGAFASVATATRAGAGHLAVAGRGVSFDYLAHNITVVAPATTTTTTTTLPPAETPTATPVAVQAVNFTG